jgi:predicted dehydrogenase
VRLAVVGCGGMGRAHIYALAYEDGVELVTLCDVYKKRYEEVCENVGTIYDKRGWTGKKPQGVQDFRHVLDDPDIDAVFFATPDHWHAIMTIMACQAGKDVYVEKPISTTVQEGRAMVEAARRYGRVVQVGTQQRSMPVFHEAMKIIKSGTLGPITTATAWIGTNYTGEQMTHGEAIPDGLDWDLWLGPAPEAEYTPERFGAFRGWHDYARGGELTNWGVHLMDILHWGIGQDAPLTVQATGGNYITGGGADNYEVVDAIFEYPGCTLTWEQRHTNQHAGLGYGMKYQGPKGQLACDRGQLIVEPESLGIGKVMFPPETTWANPDHHQNFFDCVRTRRRPAADIEQGHRSTTPTLLAGIALKVGRALQWDRDRECFINDEQANRHLSRTYRAPWHL